MGNGNSAWSSWPQPIAGARSHSNDQGRVAEMKKELSDMGMYEDGMSTDEMHQLLTVVNESKCTGSMSRTNSSIRSNSIEFSASETYRPGPSHDSSTSPELVSDAQSKRLSRDIRREPLESTETTTPETVRSRDLVETEKPNPMHSAYLMSPSPVRASEASTSTAHNESLQNTARKPFLPQSKFRSYEKPIELWQINPLDCVKNSDDKPLPSFRRRVSSRPPIRFKIGDDVPEELMKISQLKLMEISNEYYKKKHANCQNKPVVWGAPIKIRMDAGGSPAEKDFKAETSTAAAAATPVQQRTQGSVIGTRSGLRSEDKWRTVRKKTDGGSVFDFVDDDSDEGTFETAKKKAKPMPMQKWPQEKAPLRRPRAASTKTNNHLMMTEEIEVTDPNDRDWQEKPKSRKRPLRKTPEPKNNENSSQEFEVCEQPKSSVKHESPDIIDVTEVTDNDYPRRVIPPNPSRPRGRGHRLGGGERGRSVQNLLQNRPDLSVQRIETRKKQEDSLSEQQIEQALITDDEDDDNIYDSKRTSGRRAEQALAMLTDAKKTEENQDRQRQEAERQRRERVERERQERVQNNIREARGVERAKEAMENRQRQKNEFYRAGLPVKLGRRPELEGEQARNRDTIELDDGPSRLPETNMFVDNSPPPRVFKIQCPICQKMFAEGQEIEEHAQNCDDYYEDDAGDVEEVERTPTPESLECHVCNRFRTRDGNDLEEHVSHCIPRSKHDGASGSNATPIHVPDSPIRSFQPVSALRDPTIDYRGQTNPKILANRNLNARKRRRI